MAKAFENAAKMTMLGHTMASAADVTLPPTSRKAVCETPSDISTDFCRCLVLWPEHFSKLDLLAPGALLFVPAADAWRFF